MADGDGQKVAYDLSVTDKTLHKDQHALPAYALYQLLINSPTPTAKLEAVASESANYSTCIDDSTTTNFSLSVICTSLSSEREIHLQNTVTVKLCKGSLIYFKGNISAIEFSGEGDNDDCQASYYYCLLCKQPTPAMAAQAPDGAMGDDDSQQFLVCFIHSAELHLFQAELDKYSINLLPYLNSREQQSYLAGWWPASTKYLTTCVRTLGENLKYLIYWALLDAQLDISCTDDQRKADIISFLECCSLAELLSTVAVESKSDTLKQIGSAAVMTGSDTATQANISAVTLHLDGTTCQLSSHDCNQFCEEWASALTMGDLHDPVFIRQIIENCRLKAIQDMNTLKRLLRQAESDYYSLFRCAMFLRQCGNSTVLLHHAALESNGSDRGVLDVLHCHLEAYSAKST